MSAYLKYSRERLGTGTSEGRPSPGSLVSGGQLSARSRLGSTLFISPRMRLPSIGALSNSSESRARSKASSAPTEAKGMI
jgi:hypothetical protein